MRVCRRNSNGDALELPRLLDGGNLSHALSVCIEKEGDAGEVE